MNIDMKARVLNHEDKCKIKVRFNDTDMMGIVHFKNYMVYFDDGFVSFMNSLLFPIRIEDTVHKGTAFGIKKVEIIYQNSAKFGDYVVVETKIKKIGKSSITFQHDIFRESDKSPLASIECVRIAMELKTNKLLNVEEFFTKNLP